MSIEQSYKNTLAERDQSSRLCMPMYKHTLTELFDLFTILAAVDRDHLMRRTAYIPV